MMFQLRQAQGTIGAMGRYNIDAHSGFTLYRWIILAVCAAILLEIALLVGHLIFANSQFSLVLRHWVHMLSLVTLVGVVVLHIMFHASLRAKDKAYGRQTEALVSMMIGVKHELNNDMQVVVGNSELAEILLAAGDDVKKPVQNIARAATSAVSKIEQLSMFSALNKSTKSLVDLNAIFRECSAEIASELPSNVVLRLELEKLPFRVVADRHLLALSVSNLIRQAVQHMGLGGEIMLCSYDTTEGRTKPGSGVVSAALALVFQTEGSANDADKVRESYAVNALLDSSVALIELAGGDAVRRSRASYDAVIQMEFNTEMTTSNT